MKFQIAATLAFVLIAQGAAAQSTGIEFTMGAGAKTSPGYFGDDDQDVAFQPYFKLERLQFGGVSVGGGAASYGLGYHGAFGIVSGRSAADYSELAGLDSIDTSLELGAGLHYRTQYLYAYADARYGVIGHESAVAEIGADVTFDLTDKLTFSAGPRAVWGSDDYSQTYFGVSAAEAAASSFAQFDASQGFVSSGIEAKATYQFNDVWGLIGKVRYDVLQGDAADSPISFSDDQLTVGLVLNRKVTFGF